jgi:effector-binding domain-containing protein
MNAGLDRRGVVIALALLAAHPHAVFAQDPPAGAPAPAPNAPDPMEEPSADASNAQELQLVARPALFIESNALWDDNFVTMRESFNRLTRELGTLGLKQAGPPLAVYLDTDDAGFKFKAMLPVEAAPNRPPLDPTIKLGETPSGKALRFAHVGAFDELDSLYEAITGYLDEKQLTMRTPYLEEYLSPLIDPEDKAFKINIYVILDESKPPPAPATPDPDLPPPPDLKPPPVNPVPPPLAPPPTAG